jgi:hypothetical protein
VTTNGSTRSSGISSRELLVLVALFATMITAPARGQCSRVEESAELFAGGAWSLPLPIVVESAGERVRFLAHYATRPFQDAPYYSYRVGRTSVGRGAEVEMLHHKLYLENPRPPVEWLEVSHGYNQPMVNFLTPSGGWRWRIGLGLVVAHPEGVVGGRAVGPLRTLLGGGYVRRCGG